LPSPAQQEQKPQADPAQKAEQQRPQGKLTSTICASHWIKNRLLDVLKRLQNAV
jgi:hypothetical protein